MSFRVCCTVRSPDTQAETPSQRVRRSTAALLFMIVASGAMLATRGLASTPPERPAAPAAGVDLVLIVDTSKTMVGKGGGANIFGEVKAACKELIKELAPHDTVTIIPYGTDVRPQPTVTLLTETERLRLFQIVDDLRADDNWTYTAAALEAGLREAARLEGARPDGHRVVVILTDGLNEPPPAATGAGPTLEEITQPYAGKPWYVFQVQLGSRVDPGLSQALRVFPHGKTIHDPRGAGLADLPRQLQPPPPERFEWRADGDAITVSLTALDVPSSGALTVGFPPAIAATTVTVDLETGSLPAGLDAVVRRDEGTGSLRVTVEAAARRQLADGRYEATLRIALPAAQAAWTADAREVPVVVLVDLPPATWPYWRGGLLLFALLAFTIALVARMRRARRLFGSLEAWPTASPAQITRIGDLSAYGGETGLGGTGVALPGVTRRLARLRTRPVEGERHVVLLPDPGVRVTLDGRTQSELVLYDGDIAEIDAWTIRYRGEVPRRPRN